MQSNFDIEERAKKWVQEAYAQVGGTINVD